MEERDVARNATITQITHPTFFDRSVVIATLTTGDHPVYASQIQIGQRAKQRFRTDEANRARDSA